MTPTRRDQLLRGHMGIAKKIYGVIPEKADLSVFDIATAIKTSTGAGVDIHVMRGCLAKLKESGLIKEVVPGRFRLETVKIAEKIMDKTRITEPVIRLVGAPSPDKTELNKAKISTIDLLSDMAARMTALGERYAKEAQGLAKEIEDAALQIDESNQAAAREAQKLKQLQTLPKDLG